MAGLGGGTSPARKTKRADVLSTPARSFSPASPRLAREDGRLRLLRGEREAVRQRLEHLAEDLQHGLGRLRHLGDEAVELRLGEVVLKLERVGRSA